MHVEVRALHFVVASWFVRDLLRRRCGLGSFIVHLDLKDVMPVRTEGHVEAAMLVKDIGVNGIIWHAGIGFDADGPMVGPGTQLHVRGACQTNRRGLGAERRD